MTTKIPKFIVIEGVEASGKSTQLQLLALALRARGHRVTVTAEPTTERLGVFAREMLESGEATAHVAALLFAADRAEHCDALIRPALGRGEVVLCDRYLLSSIVYQGEHGLDASWIRSVNRHALEPDLTFVLELLDAATADERRRLRRRDKDIAFAAFGDREAHAWLTDRYRVHAPPGACFIDAGRSRELVTADMLGHLVARGL